MRIIVGFCQFTDAFRDMGRKDQFSYYGLKALFNYLEDLYEELGEEYTLDVIALCCDYTEYDDIEEVINDYPDIKDLDQLEHTTAVLKVEGSDRLIVEAF